MVFNEFLGLYTSKTFLRGIYITSIFIFLGYKLLSENFKIYFSKTDIVVIFYISYLILRYIVQVVFDKTVAASSIVFLQTIIPILIFFIAKEVDCNTSKIIESIMPILSAISVLVGLVDSRVKILPNIGSFRGGLYAGIGDANVLRAYSLAGNALITGFICSLGLCFLLMNKYETKASKLFKYITMVILFTGLLNTLSRGAFFMLVIALIVYFTDKNNLYKIITRKKKIVIVVLCIVCLIFLIVFKWNEIINMSSVKRFLIVGLNINESSNSLRINYHKKAFLEVMNYPLFGKGFGYTGIHAQSLNFEKWINTESYILTRLITGGIIDCLIFIIISVKTIFRKRIFNLEKKYVSILISMFAWSTIYILLDSDLIAIFYWYCIGKICSNIDLKNGDIQVTFMSRI